MRWAQDRDRKTTEEGGGRRKEPRGTRVSSSKAHEKQRERSTRVRFSSERYYVLEAKLKGITV